MLIYLIKFIHLIATLSLLGSAVYALILVGKTTTLNRIRPSSPTLTLVNKCVLWLSVIALITGTLLVYPKHYDFHTPWIDAAYLLLIIFCSGISLINYLKKRHLQKKGDLPFSKSKRFLWQLFYAVLILLLIGIIHDAVTKTTLW